MATISNFPGRHPQFAQIPTTAYGLVGLYRLESNASPSVGGTTLTQGKGGDGQYPTHGPLYGRFGSGAKFTPDTADTQFEASYYYSNSIGSEWRYTANKTYMFWAKEYNHAAVASGNIVMFAIGTGDDRCSCSISSGDRSQVKWSLRNQGDSIQVSFYSDTSLVNFQDDKWHHFAFVIEGNTQKFYVDGVLHDQATQNMGTMDTWTGLKFNSSVYADAFSGYIHLDEVAAFNRSISQAEMRAFGGGGLV